MSSFTSRDAQQAAVALALGALRGDRDRTYATITRDWPAAGPWSKLALAQASLVEHVARELSFEHGVPAAEAVLKRTAALLIAPGATLDDDYGYELENGDR